MSNPPLMIINKRGLHARAATKLAKLAGLFSCDIAIRIADPAASTPLSADEKWVDCKSVMGLMLMAATQGTYIELRTQGPDSATAYSEIAQLINDYFGEGE